MSDSTTGAPRSGLIWVTGYSGSGKTTVARHVERTLRGAGEQVIFLDGDDLRSIFARRWGYEKAERVELASVYFRLSSHLASQGCVVVIAAVAMYDEVRAWVRANVPNSTVAYLEVPHDVRIARDADTKQIYSTGADLELMYDEPTDADISVPNFGDTSPAAAAAAIVEHFLSHRDSSVADRGKGAHWDDYYATTSTAKQDPSSFAVAAEARFPRGAKVLEVGCGNGRDTAYFGAQGHHVTALDASSAAIDLCRRTYDGTGLSVDFVTGVVPDHAADWGGRFDVLYSRFVIHAMTETEEQALWALAGALIRPGGLIAIECRSIKDPLARQGEVLSATERIAGHYRRFIVLDDLVKRLADHAFTVEETVEDKGLAVYQDDDPVVIRAFARG